MPHAGYIFSGDVAAYAYAQIPLQHTFRRIFILASSHRTSFAGLRSLPAGITLRPWVGLPLMLTLPMHSAENMRCFRTANRGMHMNIASKYSFPCCNTTYPVCPLLYPSSLGPKVRRPAVNWPRPCALTLSRKTSSSSVRIFLTTRPIRTPVAGP